ncbi:MAG TPA: hypothetical protein VJA40_04835 [archaeon]|nr:hypothetical protein [archaeon]
MDAKTFLEKAQNFLLTLLLAGLFTPLASAQLACEGIDLVLPDSVTASVPPYEEDTFKINLPLGDAHVSNPAYKIRLVLEKDNEEHNGVCECNDSGSCSATGYEYECAFDAADLGLVQGESHNIDWDLTAFNLPTASYVSCKTQEAKLKVSDDRKLKDVVVEKFVSWTPVQQDVLIKAYNNSRGHKSIDLLDEVLKDDGAGNTILSRVIPSDAACRCVEPDCRTFPDECLYNSRLNFTENSHPLPPELFVTENDPVYTASFKIEAGQVDSINYSVKDAANDASTPTQVQLAGCEYSLLITQPEFGQRFPPSDSSSVLRFEVQRGGSKVFSPRVEVNLTNPQGNLQALTLSTYYHPRESEKFYETAFLMNDLGEYNIEVKLNNEFCPGIRKEIKFSKAEPKRYIDTPGFDATSMTALAALLVLFALAKVAYRGKKP